MNASSLIDEGTIAAFERDGAVPIRGCFVPWVDSLRRGIEYNIAHPGPDVRDYRDEEAGASSATIATGRGSPSTASSCSSRRARISRAR